MKNEYQILQCFKNMALEASHINDLHQLMEVIFKKYDDLIAFDYGGIFLRESEDGVFNLVWSDPADCFLNTSFESKQNDNEVIKHLIRDKRAIFIKNIAQQANGDQIYFTKTQDEKSILGVPLIKNEDVEGIFLLLSRESDKFSSQEQLVLECFNAFFLFQILVGSHFENAFLEVKQVVRNLFGEPRDKAIVFNEIVESALKLTASQAGCIALWDPSENKFICRGRDTCPIFKESSGNISFCHLNNDKLFCNEILRQRNNNSNLAILHQRHLSKLADNNHTSHPACLALPLIDRQEDKHKNLIGVLILNNQHKVTYYPEDIEVLHALAELGISAYKNSQSFYEIQKMIDKLALVSNVTNTLLAEFENKPLEAKFDFIVEKATEILEAELCTLWLVDADYIYIKTSFGRKHGLGEAEKIDKQKGLPIKSGPGAGLHGHIAFTREIHNLYGTELWNHPATHRLGTSDFLSTDISYSSLNYPMVDDKGNLLGLFCAYNKLDESGQPFKNRGFSREFDEPLMKILTTKLMISIKNSQLVNELNQSLHQLRNYRTIIENTPDLVIMTNNRGRITYMNAGAMKLTGDLTGKRVTNLYFSDEVSSSREKVSEIARKLLENPEGSLRNEESVFQNKDGVPIPVNLSACVLRDQKGNLTEIVGIAKDLREIKALLDIGNSLLSTYHLEEILRNITQVCLRLPKSKRAYINLFDEKQQCLTVNTLICKDGTEQLPVQSNPCDRRMAAHVFKTKKFYVTGNMRLEPPEFQSELFSDINSRIVMPINTIDVQTGQVKVLGVICIDSEELNAFSVNDIYFIQTLASQAATAIVNAKLISANLQVIKELSALKQIQESITTYLNTDQILECVLDVVIETLRFDYATISEVDRARGMVGTVKGRNVSGEFINQAWHPLESNDIQAWVVRNKEEQLLSGWDERLDPELYRKYNHQNLVRVYLPIISRKEAYGTLETGYFKSSKPEIEEEELAILRKIVDLAGIGIDQAYLVEEQKILVDQLEVLNQASVDVQCAQIEEEVFEHIFKCLEKIGYSKGMLSLINENTGIIEGRYAAGKNWQQIKKMTRRELSSNDVLALVIRKKRPKLSKHCPSDPTCDQKAVKKGNVISQYVLPLIANDQAIGTLQIDLSDKQGLVKGTEEVLRRRLEILKTFASQIAIAICNLRDKGIIRDLKTTIMETAHEFRSPLHNILTQIGGLKSYLSNNLEAPKEIDEIFQIISEEAHRASKQMDNTLMFSEESRSLMGYNFEKGYLQEIIFQCANNHRLRALERGISIIVKDSVKKLPPFKFDKQKMEQVINNLLDNAVKYSHYNRFVQVRGWCDGSKIYVEIWDKGLGIPEEDFDNIFKGFTRGKRMDQTRYIPGTGIGLKISKEIVTEHGGEIKVKSTPFLNDPHRIKEYEGYDTIFTIILPIKR